jgi:hypothetical protein
MPASSALVGSGAHSVQLPRHCGRRAPIAARTKAATAPATLAHPAPISGGSGAHGVQRPRQRRLSSRPGVYSRGSVRRTLGERPRLPAAGRVVQTWLTRQRRRGHWKRATCRCHRGHRARVVRHDRRSRGLRPHGFDPQQQRRTRRPRQRRTARRPAWRAPQASPASIGTAAQTCVHRSPSAATARTVCSRHTSAGDVRRQQRARRQRPRRDMHTTSIVGDSGAHGVLQPRHRRLILQPGA